MPERLDPMLGLTDMVDLCPTSLWESSGQQVAALEPEKVLQRELKQSSWAAKVMADEHAISA